MFDFVRKDHLFAALDRGDDKRLKLKRQFDLKTIQDLAVYEHLRDANALRIAEIGGGNSRLLRALKSNNQCVNIDKFEGVANGPKKKPRLWGVETLNAYLGEFDPRLKDRSFDVAFSVSVVEHLTLEQLWPFFEDGLRILKQGGLWLHAIDMYVDAETDPHSENRLQVYRQWAANADKVVPCGAVYNGAATFTTDMATNPDNIMHEWGAAAPGLIDRRKRAQSVSIILASRKI